MNGGQQADDFTLEELLSPAETQTASSNTIAVGPLILPQHRVLIYSADEWELFIHEWVHYKKREYQKVVRMAGAGDKGVDVAGLTDDKGLFGVWDNYQCKHYDNPLTPGVALPEIAKILWYSFCKVYVSPRKYYFIAPKDCGTTLEFQLNEPDKLRQELIDRWAKNCSAKITSKAEINLDGDFRKYVESFNFSIFKSKTVLEIIDEHRNTPYHSARFGGGLPSRPASEKPPETLAEKESRYIGQLYESYGDHKKSDVASRNCLAKWPDLQSHYDRQREAFYEAEALRNFARDNVPPGTFESLQEDVLDGVIEVESSGHADGYARMNQVLTAAAQTDPRANGLISVIRTKDKKGICHQLANVDKLRWKK